MLSATAIANFLACQHLTTLDRAEAAGDIKKDFFPDPGLELLIQLGEEHERAYLKGLQEKELEIVEIPTEMSRTDAVAATIAALHEGVDVVYQPVFEDGDWYGRADFLRRVETPSALGDWSYEVVETKLARSTKVRAIIQLCHYSDLLSRIQGTLPDLMHVVLGGGTLPQEYQTKHYLAYFRKIKREFMEAFEAKPSTYPEPNEHCRICDWFARCDEQWRADDSLTLVANISRNQRKALGERDVSTLSELARLTLPVTPKIERIGKQALLNIREQARVQLEGRKQERPFYEFLKPVEPERGLAKLPPPSTADIFLDFESAPFAFEIGLEYLFGLVTTSDVTTGTPNYDATWALNRADEKKAFEKFMTWVMERWAATPEMHIYHYAPYEQTAIKRLVGRHSCFVDEVDRLLRGGVFVDLFQVVRQSLRASVESYSIKDLEPFYKYTRERALPDAIKARVSLEAFLSLGETKADLSALRNIIEEYNRDDCLSALRLREWLEVLRIEVETQTGEAIPRPAPKESAPSEKLAAESEEVIRLSAKLLTGIPEDETQRTGDEQARWLLANLLDWNRREAKSTWWEYYRLRELSDSELQEDKNALGGLEYIEVVDKVKKSLVHRYRFPPQSHSIDRARDVRDPQTGKGVGTIVAVDDPNGLIHISRIATSTTPHPKALIACDVIDAVELRDSLLRLASWVVENGITAAGPYQAARDLLLRRPPNLSGETIESARAKSEDLTETSKQLALTLDHSALPIQGPPGSGKTYIGARMVLELVKNGRRVGITATSHQVISNLLKELCSAARKSGYPLRVIQKVTDKADGFVDDMVQVTTKNEAVPAALASGEAQVAAGTAWLWARAEMANLVDVLFVDEAGQVSLAYALAASQGAGSLVLLGDPQQLDQPVKGVHPPGTDISALAHLLSGQTTITKEQGLFLDETWRLHRDVCDFTSEVFYEGRLISRNENQNQSVNAEGPLSGTGLRFVPIIHSGNQNESPEEVERVNGLVRGLLASSPTWTDREGFTKSIGIDDILVVAPYNAQVSALRKSLPEGARVGTVDKFQGQEAPVVIYSMATSTPEDAPRGMEFLYSSNRLNVATSRAQCVTVLVASPDLFHVQCKTPRQMKLANAFCRYLEMARSI
jgi:predicted RecB family nuclease